MSDKKTKSKLGTADKYHIISMADMTALAAKILHQVGCDQEIAEAVADHLVETSLMGVESHGVMRLMQYAEQLESGYMDAKGRPELRQNEKGAWIVDGHDGFGIPAMNLAVDHACAVAKEQGMSVIGIINCGHTGRIGAFAERGAKAGCLTITLGGGGRKAWRQVAPYGGSKGMLPTNPYAFGIPGGKRGPIVLDFATSKIAGGWIYAAKSAGLPLPAGAVIDADGNPTRNPDDYLNGGAILPFGGPKGYGLALMAELIGDAMLGPITTEMNWLLICIDTERYREPTQLQAVAEEMLQELRQCPPAPGFERVEIPGEREREQYALNAREGIPLPERTWNQMQALALRLGVSIS